jgi:hypothetical protein
MLSEAVKPMPVAMTGLSKPSPGACSGATTATKTAAFRTLHANAAALSQFLLQQVLWVLTLLGIAMMFAPLGHDALGIKLLYVIRFALGGLMYLIGVYALGTAHHLTHQPERTMQKLEDRIRELEGRRANVIRPAA